MIISLSPHLRLSVTEQGADQQHPRKTGHRLYRYILGIISSGSNPLMDSLKHSSQRVGRVEGDDLQIVN